MASYICEKCGHDFPQKSALSRHMKNKTPCVEGEQTAATNKKKMGQYFTINDTLQQFVYDAVKYKGAPLLEPSFGAGHLLKKFKESNPDYPMICYELDSTIVPILEFNAHQVVVYGDFTKQTITQKFKTIIGNPPYVKQQASGNLYIKFIEMCYNLLDTDGELIFIVPSDFLKLTSASSLIDTMVKNGSFTDFRFPHDEKLFEGASIDVVVFRYEKGILSKFTKVNGEEMLCNVTQGIITFSHSELKGTPLSDLFHVYVGIVSGRDEIYRVPFGNIEVLNDKDKIEKYIFCTTFPTKNPQIDAHLTANKEALLERRIKKFTESNWFEWGAPRNIKSIEANLGKSCIYIRNMTRNQNVSFTGTMQYFGGSLLCLLPKQEMDHEQLQKIVSYLNSADFQKDYMYAGRFKIGHKQVSNAIMPH